VNVLVVGGRAMVWKFGDEHIASYREHLPDGNFRQSGRWAKARTAEEAADTVNDLYFRYELLPFIGYTCETCGGSYDAQGLDSILIVGVKSCDTCMNVLLSLGLDTLGKLKHFVQMFKHAWEGQDIFD